MLWSGTLRVTGLSQHGPPSGPEVPSFLGRESLFVPNLVHPEDLASAVALVRRTFRLEAPGARFRRMERWNFLSYYVEGFGRPLQIDFFTGLSKAWLVYADSRLVLERVRLTEAGIRIPHPRDELELIAAKELLSYGRLREKYHAYFHTKAEQLPEIDKSVFAGRLTPVSIARIRRLLEDPTSCGPLRPTTSALLAPRAFCIWLSQRTNDFC